MFGSVLYSLVRLLLDLISTSNGKQAKLQLEVLALRVQVQVLERQIKRVRWSPGDRMVLAALRERIPRSGWAGLLVKPGTVLGWHRELVRPTLPASGRIQRTVRLGGLLSEYRQAPVAAYVISEPHRSCCAIRPNQCHPACHK